MFLSQQKELVEAAGHISSMPKTWSAKMAAWPSILLLPLSHPWLAFRRPQTTCRHSPKWGLLFTASKNYQAPAIFSANWENQQSSSALERYLLPTGPIAQLYQIANFGNLNVRVDFLLENMFLGNWQAQKTEAKAKTSRVVKWRAKFGRWSNSKMAQSWRPSQKNSKYRTPQLHLSFLALQLATTDGARGRILPSSVFDCRQKGPTFNCDTLVGETS